MSVLFLSDISHVSHAFYHISTNPRTKSPNDEYDVVERVVRKLDDLVPFMESFFEAANVAGPYHFVAVFDRPKPRDLFRSYLLPEYKQSRTKHEGLDEIEAAILAAVKQCDRWLSVVAPPLMESDDTIASLAHQWPSHVMIYSQDRDFHQCLVDKRVSILKKANKPDVGSDFEMELFTARTLAETGLRPEQWVDFQTLKGGKDDVPGWDGVGDKKAMELITWGGDLALVDLDENAPSLNKTQRESYPRFSVDLDRLRRIQTLRNDLPWPIELAALQPQLEAVH